MDRENLVAWLSRSLQGNPPSLATCGPDTLQELIRLADWHGITALLFYRLNETGSWNECPALLVDQLSESNRNAAAMSLLWQHEITDLYGHFKAAQIPSLLLKGFPLAFNLYPVPYLRPFGDVDILFPDHATAEQAGIILETAGYTRPNEVSGEYLCHQFSCNRQTTTGFLFTIGLHWRLNNANYFASAFSYDELASASVPVNLPGSSMRTLSSVHALIFACMHRLAHAVDGKSDRLIWLYDIHLLTSTFNQQQWRWFIDLATEKKLCSVCLDGLEKCSSRLHTYIPGEIIRTLKTHAPDEPYQPLYNAPSWKFHLVNIQSLPNWSARLKLLREHLFPAPEYMYAKFNCRHKVLLPLLYIRRTAQGLPKLMRRNTVQ